MKPETAQIIEWLRTGVQGSTKPNREKAAQCIEQLHGAVVTLEARKAELERLLKVEQDAAANRFADECAPLMFVENIPREKWVTPVDADALKALRKTLEKHDQMRRDGWMPLREELDAAVRRLLAGGVA